MDSEDNTKNDLSGVEEQAHKNREILIATRISTALREIVGAEFNYIKQIGSGVGGEVYLCEYTGTDAAIKSLCDPYNRISIKVAREKHELKHEAEILFELYHQSAEVRQKKRYTVGIPLIKEGEAAALLMNYVSYNDSIVAPQEDSLKSYLKKFYHAVVAGNAISKTPSDKLHKALYDDGGIIIAQLMNEMQNLLFEVHHLGFLHLDFAARNLILNNPVMNTRGDVVKLTLVLCDFGHAGKMNKEGIVHTYQQRKRKPLTARDYEDIVNHKASVNTDIFALKCAAMGMISMLVANLMHDYNVLDIGQKSINEFKSLRTSNEMYNKDTVVLNCYLKKLIDYIAICPDDNIKKQATDAINCYKKYILTMPSVNATLDEAHNADRAELLSANVEYFKFIIKDKMASITDINNNVELEAFFSSISRILAIPLPEHFKLTEQYHEIQRLDSIDKVKQYLKKLIKRVADTQNSLKENIQPSLRSNSEKLQWVEQLNNDINQWKKTHDAMEIKWLGKDFEKQADAIVNSVMKGHITVLRDAQKQLKSLVDSFEVKLKEKKLEKPKFKKPLQEMQLQDEPCAGYINKQRNTKE